MDERVLIRVVAQVRVYDRLAKRWDHVGTGKAIVGLTHRLSDNTFRMHGEQIDNDQVVLDKRITKRIKFKRIADYFIQWYEKEVPWGLKFNSSIEIHSAENLFNTLVLIVDTLNQGRIQQPQQPEQQPPRPLLSLPALKFLRRLEDDELREEYHLEAARRVFLEEESARNAESFSFDILKRARRNTIRDKRARIPASLINLDAVSKDSFGLRSTKKLNSLIAYQQSEIDEMLQFKAASNNVERTEMVSTTMQKKAKKVSTKSHSRAKRSAVIARVKCLGKQHKIVVINKKKRLRLMEERKEKKRRELKEIRAQWREHIAKVEKEVERNERMEISYERRRERVEEIKQLMDDAYLEIMDNILTKVNTDEVKKARRRR